VEGLSHGQQTEWQNELLRKIQQIVVAFYVHNPAYKLPHAPKSIAVTLITATAFQNHSLPL
jgi:hypothetical protein